METDKSIFNKIKAEYPELTNSYKKVARFVLENYHELAFMTAAKVAKRVNVSESVVIRFAAHIGYSGYPGLQKHIRSIVKSELSPYQRLNTDKKIFKGNSSVQKIVTMDRANIEKTIKNLDQNKIKKIAADIVDAHHIWLIGSIESGALARLFGLLLQYIFSNVTIIDNFEPQQTLLLKRVQANDIVIGFNFARYAQNTLTAMLYCKKKCAKTVTFTDSEFSPSIEIASTSLVASVDMFSFFNSYTSVIMLINLLIGEIANQDSNRTKDELQQLEEIFQSFKYLFKSQ